MTDPIAHNCSSAPFYHPPIRVHPSVGGEPPQMVLDLNDGEYTVPIYFCPYCGSSISEILGREK